MPLMVAPWTRSGSVDEFWGLWVGLGAFLVDFRIFFRCLLAGFRCLFCRF